MSNVPPPPYAATVSGGTKWITIDGKKYYPFGTNGYTDFNFNDWKPVTSAITKMARWEITAKAGDPDKYSDFETTKCKAWLAPGGHTSDNAQGVVAVYADVVGHLPSVGLFPGEGKVTAIAGGVLSVGEFLAKLVGWITDPHWWVRVLEVLMGGALIAIGAAHMSGAAKSALNSVPVVGKVL